MKQFSLPWWTTPVWKWSYYEDRNNALSPEEKDTLKYIYKWFGIYYLAFLLLLLVMTVPIEAYYKGTHYRIYGYILSAIAGMVSLPLARRKAAKLFPERTALADKNAASKFIR